MEIFETVSELRSFRRPFFGSNKIIGLVPTMGALHDGHAKLIRESKQKCDITLVSVFVNPAQFNNEEDLENYPRTWEEDEKLLQGLGVDGVFHPQLQEIYNSNISIRFTLGDIGNQLEGKHRPGHFNGVALIVAKLFNIVQPTIAFFGEKDLQQLQIIRKLTSELAFPVKIKGVATVRDEEGLALSSRNSRLSHGGVDTARKINRGLEKGGVLLRKRESTHVILRSILEYYKSEAPGLTVEYCEIVEPETMQPVKNYRDLKNVAICVAAYVEGVRLIDNVYLQL